MSTTTSAVKQQQVCLQNTDNDLHQATTMHSDDRQQIPGSKRVSHQTHTNQELNGMAFKSRLLNSKDIIDNPVLSYGLATFSQQL